MEKSWRPFRRECDGMRPVCPGLRDAAAAGFFRMSPCAGYGRRHRRVRGVTEPGPTSARTANGLQFPNRMDATKPTILDRILGPDGAIARRLAERFEHRPQ